MHVRKGLPNQDRLELRSLCEGREILVAMADGHGSAHSFRSEIGATIATEVAVRLLAELVHPAGKEAPSAIKRAVETELPVRISQAWAGRVRREIKERPFSGDELAQVAEREGPRGLRRLERNPLVAYGSTLLCAVVTDAFLAYLQIGDGDVLELQGNEVRMPVPEDDRLLGNETTSLCDPRPWASFRCHFQRLAGAPPEAILLATDGYFNSFADDQDFHTTTLALHRSLRAQGAPRFQELLPEWLTTASKQGSGDDMTLALLFRQAPLELPP